MAADEELETLRSEVIRLQATLDAVLLSRSWRVTKPLRGLAARWRSHALRRVLRRIDRRRLWKSERFVLGAPVLNGAAPTRDNSATSPSVCAIVHAFYLDLLPDLVLRLQRCRDLRVAIVTYPEDRDPMPYRTALAPLGAAGVSIELVAVENRGRDMYPFAQVARRALATECDAFVKLHTKRSPHLQAAGDQWRDELLDGLLPDSATAHAAACLVRTEANFGFGVPSTRLGGRAHRGKNRQAVKRLAERAGLRVPRTLLFPAGGMYWCSRGWVETVANLALGRDDFEVEHGQLDGTTAHALERLIGCYAWTRHATVWLP